MRVFSSSFHSFVFDSYLQKHEVNSTICLNKTFCLYVFVVGLKAGTPIAQQSTINLNCIINVLCCHRYWNGVVAVEIKETMYAKWPRDVNISV